MTKIEWVNLARLLSSNTTRETGLHLLHNVTPEDIQDIKLFNRHYQVQKLWAKTIINNNWIESRGLYIAADYEYLFIGIFIPINSIYVDIKESKIQKNLDKGYSIVYRKGKRIFNNLYKAVIDINTDSIITQMWQKDGHLYYNYELC